MKHFIYTVLGATLLTISCSNTPKTQFTNMKIITLEREEAPLVDSIVATPKRKFKDSDYTIYMLGSLSQYSIWIDDILIFNHRGPNRDEFGCPTGELHINNILLKSGIHRATCRVYPLYGKSEMEYMSSAEISYHNRWFDDLYDTEDRIFEIKAANEAKKIFGNDRLEGVPYFEMSKLFYAELPFEIVGWNNSINLKECDQDKLLQEINETYNKIFNLMQNRDFDALRPLFDEFLQNRVTTFYLDQQGRDKEKEWNGFVQMLSNRSFEMQPLPEVAYLNFMANGKLATLLDENGNNIVIFANKKKPDENAAFEFKFHKRNEDSPLEII